MSLVDELLGALIEETIDDGEGGQWIVALRPRCTGPRITRTTVVRFRRPGRRNGFSVRLHVLMEATRQGGLARQDPIVESSLHFTQALAKNALTWIDALDKGTT